MQSPSWSSLPAELQLSVVDCLDATTILALSTTSKAGRALCLSRLFHSVSILSLDSLQSYLTVVPPAYGSYVRQLQICTSSALYPDAKNGSTPRTDALVALLTRTLHLERLTLRLSGGLASKAVPVFRTLRRLSYLDIENSDDEDEAPLSERVVVGIALSLPSLSHLSLSRITRCSQYADDLLRAPMSSQACIPLIVNDDPADASTMEQNPPHCLPSLFTIPSLQHLTLRDTHLGDPRFASPELDVRCQLKTLEIGAYANVAPHESAVWVSGILTRVGSNLTHVVLGAGLPTLSNRDLYLPNLKTIRFTPYMSPAQIPDTLSSVLGARAPIRDLDIECLQDDLEDVVEELDAFFDSAEPCPIANLRVHIKEDGLTGTDFVPTPDSCTALNDECSRRVRRLDGICGRVGTRVALVGATLAVPGDVGSDSEDGCDSCLSDSTAVDAILDEAPLKPEYYKTAIDTASIDLDWLAEVVQATNTHVHFA